LDETDYMILKLMRDNARIPLSHISKEIGLSSPSIRDRIDKMENEGVILGYRSILDHKKLGLAITAFVNVRLKYPNCCTDEFIESIKEINEVVEGHYTDGDEDMLLKIVVRDTGHLREVLLRLNSMRSVTNSKSIISLSTPIRER
jgi:Lrp/AsnC family transcriptional regulator for asnA, asnC and gidA